MELREITHDIADLLEAFDAERPVHKAFQPGIGPLGEPQLVRQICDRLNAMEGKYRARTRRTPDLEINEVWAIEFKLVRPFGDNGREAENWSVNLLHPYEGNISLIGDAMKLVHLDGSYRKGLFAIGYEHATPKIRLDPLVRSFELIMADVMQISIGPRIEERREGLVHPEHQVVRCFAWELLSEESK